MSARCKGKGAGGGQHSEVNIHSMAVARIQPREVRDHTDKQASLRHREVFSSWVVCFSHKEPGKAGCFAPWFLLA